MLTYLSMLRSLRSGLREITSLAASYTEEHVQSCSAERLINITSVIILIVSIFQLVPDC